MSELSDAERANPRPVVLLVSSDFKVQVLGSEALARAGFSVAVAKSRREMVELLTRRQPDVALLDLLVGEADALGLREELRSRTAGREIPVFVMSDLVDRALLLQIFKDETSDFLMKPVNWIVAIHRLRQAVSKYESVRELHRGRESLRNAMDTARDAASEAMKLRNFDPVTGLANRAMFTEMVSLAVAQGRHRSGDAVVLCLDIDSFKELNDSLGRDYGDEVLRALAGRLRGLLQAREDSPEASLARLHADEFGVLLEAARSVAEVERVAGRIMNALAEPFHIFGREVFVSVSVGIAVASNTQSELLLQCAETALVKAKRDGGKIFRFYTDDMRDQVVTRHELQQGLRRAVEDKQLRVVYQPIVEASTGLIKGVEALLRWEHPTRGAVPPSEFISLAEESGLIIEIGEWVLREGCRQLREWRDAGLPPVRMAINVAHRQLEEDSFVDTVKAALRESRLDSRYLELELSERGVLRDDERTVSKLLELDALGVSLAIDDFGTGQTTLAYLHKFPLQVLKIDRSFIHSVTEDPASAAITGAIVAMSHRLGLKVVGEGVETSAQSDILREQRCDQLQGYLYHRPMRAARLATLLKGEQRKREQVERARKQDEAQYQTEALRLVEDAPGGRMGVEEKLVRMAHLDFLTGVLNRYSFERSLEASLARAQRFGHNVALLLIDLDGFKEVNDTCGHWVGDELLKVLAGRLKERVRKVDALARLGGDEFAVIHTELADLDGVARLAERLGEMIARPVNVEGRTLRLTASIGVAVYPPGDSDAKRFCQQADLALYKAKESGGNTFRFHSKQMDRRVQKRLNLSRDLAGALKREELFLHYQPQIDLDTREIVGVEALLRWRHPGRGLVPPVEFIPLAEGTGEILDIGEWVLARACRQARSWWVEHGAPIPVSVNLSFVQFKVSGFSSAVRRVLEDVGLPPALLELELSQELLGRIGGEAEEALEELDEMGVRLCVDNFGAGKFSMEKLSNLPLSKLKIASRFTTTLDERGRCPQVVSAMIALAQKLGFRVVGEGIETADQLEALRAEGCDYGQGHLFARAESGERLSLALRAGELELPRETIEGEAKAGAEAGGRGAAGSLIRFPA